MIFIEYGRLALNHYNKINSKNLTSFEFFDQIMYPIFFNCSDEKQLLMVTNSHFVQNYFNAAQKKGVTLIKYRYDQFKSMLSKIDLNQPVKISSPGYHSAELDSTTSSQVTSNNFKITSDEVLLSWIGVSFSINIGGVDALIYDLDIIEHIFNGWQYYRDFITNGNSNVKGRQIAKWNRVWLDLHSKNIDQNYTPQELYEATIQDITIKPLKGGVFELEIFDNNWFKFLYNYSNFTNKDEIDAYAFSLGQTNETYGFFKIKNKDIKYLKQIIRETVPIEYQSEYSLEFYKTEYDTRKAIKNGGFMLKTMEPEKLFSNKPKPTKLTKLYLKTMINDNQLNENAKTYALELQTLERGFNKNLSEHINSILSSKTKQYFLDKSITLIEFVGNIDKTSFMTSLKEDVISLPDSKVVLFLTLIKFEFLTKK